MLGSRELLKRVQMATPELNLNIPEGFPCPNVETALQASKYLIDTNRGVVFKANLGVAGIGVFVFSPKEYALKTTEGRNWMETKVRENTLLQSGPIIVEEYTQPDFNHRGVFPSVDSLIKVDGVSEVQAVSAMSIHRNENEVEFYGSTLGKGLFTKKQSNLLRKINMAVGQELSKLGYRGWYDTDFILTSDGRFYLTEANVRRTGTAYMVELAKKLFGEDWENKIAMIANDKFISPELENMTYPELKNKLTDIAYPIKRAQRGIIITQSMRSMYNRGKFGYVSIGKSQEDAELLQEKLIKKLS